MRRKHLTSTDAYFEAWQHYRRTWWLCALATPVLFCGGGLLTTYVLTTWVFSDSGVAVLIGTLPWLIAVVLLNSHGMRWPCPRCGKPYFSATLYYNSFARRCLHCGLPKWAPRDVDQQSYASGTAASQYRP